MSNSYSLTISSIEIYPFHQNKKNVISSLEWILNATDSEGNYAGCHGKQKLEYTTESNFIELNNLTEEMLVGWVESLIGENQINIFKNTLDEHLVFHSNLTSDHPRRIVLIPPWNSKGLVQ